MVVHVAPDIERIVCDTLRDHAEVEALGTVGVSTALPATFDPATSRHVTVTQTDAETPNRWWRTTASLDLNCYAPTREAASLLARTVYAVLLHDVRGTTHSEGVVTNVTEENGPQWLPDPTYPSPASRFVCSVAVTAHPPTS